jgi:hypothetical protein
MIKYVGEFAAKDCEQLAYTSNQWAVEYLSHYMYIDGAHHKQWLLDQIARVLMGTPVVVKEARWEDGHTEIRFTTGEPSQQYIEWRGKDWDEDDEGIAP